ncbi:hypothetical protein CDL15_Pgr015760 [Punica granatum]|uniref:Uncharacterized protein n=1 Tax=Punica granatum TaxID=22663 RepID=A0A218XP64_PUNGR|nr:hypothetical protein CDL15_Pgr015760 [Punica granatum]
MRVDTNPFPQTSNVMSGSDDLRSILSRSSGQDNQETSAAEEVKKILRRMFIEDNLCLHYLDLDLISQEHGDNSNTNAAASQADDVATHPNSSAAINKGKQSIVQDARGVAADTETVAREQGKRQVLNKRIGALYDGRFKRHWSFRNRGVAAGRLAATEIEESNDSNARGVDMSLQSHLEALAGLDYPKRLRSVVQRVPATERPLANVLAEQWRRAVHPRNPWPLTRTQKKKILMHI